MKNWKIIIDFEGKEQEIVIQAPYYSDAYISASNKFPGATIKSIKPAESTKPENGAQVS